MPLFLLTIVAIVLTLLGLNGFNKRDIEKLIKFIKASS
jgi:putative exporter of polyketide antibiotics